MIDNSFLGTFPSSELDPVQLDGIMAFALNKGDIEAGRSLMGSKWWDYRFVHPGLCYFLYAHHFSQNVTNWRAMFGVNVNARLRYNDHPIWRTERDGCKAYTVLSPPAYRTGLWRGVCHADLYGIPYDFWIARAFEFAFETKWVRMPTPNHVYGPAVAQHILGAWEEHSSQLLRVPADPRYLAENFIGDPTQVEFQRWLLKKIRERPNPVVTLCNFLTTEPLVDLTTARETLGNVVVDEALRRIGSR